MARARRAVEAHRVEGVKNFMLGIYESDVKSPQTLTYTYRRPGMDSNETSCKRHGDSAGGRVDSASMTEDATYRRRPAVHATGLPRRAKIPCRCYSGSAVRAPRLPCRAKIWRRSYNFDIALSAEEKRLLNDMACARA